MTSSQPSKLLPGLFEHAGEDQRLTVLHIGAALPETVAFFSNYRCKLHFVDLFAELPIVETEEGPSLQQQFADHLQFPPDTQFDICLFWDVFNYLDSGGISAFISALHPYLHTETVAHAYVVHNRRAPQGNELYGIRQADTISLRQRAQKLPGYAPHPQSDLKTRLACFTFDRSLLLTDGRLELLLKARSED